MPSFLCLLCFLWLIRLFLNYKWHRYGKMYSSDDVLFLTTKGTEITKFSDVFIFVPFALSVVVSIVFELQMAQVSQNVFFDLKYLSAKVYEHAMLCFGSFEIG